MTQTPPLLSRLTQGYLDHTGIEECPYHQNGPWSARSRL